VVGEIRQIYGILTRFATFRKPGAYLIDVWPELESWPIYDMLSGWKKTADEIYKKDTAVFTHFWNKMRKAIEDGTAPHSWGKLFVRVGVRLHSLSGSSIRRVAVPPVVNNELCTINRL
jgi:hypothetical protein